MMNTQNEPNSSSSFFNTPTFTRSVITCKCCFIKFMNQMKSLHVYNYHLQAGPVRHLCGLGNGPGQQPEGGIKARPMTYSRRDQKQKKTHDEISHELCPVRHIYVFISFQHNATAVSDMNPSFNRDEEGNDATQDGFSLMSQPYNIERTPAPAMARRMLAPAPLKRDLAPSFFRIWLKASSELLYLTASPDVIIMRLLTVSIGYDASPAPFVITHPNAKLAKKLS
ncbi:hypothetical protein LXL04_033994 [Taraxacum kok-saghyz]